MLSLLTAILFAHSATEPASSQIEFSFPQTIDPGGCIVELVASSEGENHVQFDGSSPDGRLYAVGWDDGSDENASNVNQRGAYLLNLETGERTDIPLLNNVASFSPDGSQLVSASYQENGRTDIVLYSLATGEAEVLAAHDNWDFLPSFSADGRQILFHSSRAGNPDLYLYDLESQALTRLTTGDNWEMHAQFSPDGAFVSYYERVSETNYDIRLLELSTGETIALTNAPSEEGYPSWHPDGEHLVFTSNRDRENGTADVYVMSRNGDVLARLTDAPFYHGYPFWSPDGSFVYFTSYRAPQGVYRIPMDGPTQCRQPATDSR